MKKSYLMILAAVLVMAACAGEGKKTTDGETNVSGEPQEEFVPCDIPLEERRIVGFKLGEGDYDLVHRKAITIILQNYYKANMIEDLTISEVKHHLFLTGKAALNEGGTISFGIQIKGVCNDKLFFTREAAFEQTAISKDGCEHCDLVLHDEHDGAHSGEGDTECCHHAVSELEASEEGGFSHMLFVSEQFK